jgi:hypothetical protein
MDNMRKKKDTRCPICKKPFKQFNTLQRTPHPTCALELVERDRKAKEKKQRAKDKLERDAFRPYSYWVKKAQSSFNKYVRERDRWQRCISSGREMNWMNNSNSIDAGHYRSTGSAPHLRFHLHNCHAQSVEDNRWKSGNAVDYRLNLIKKIGIEKVEALENDDVGRRYSVEELKRIAVIFRKKARLLKKRRER